MPFFAAVQKVDADSDCRHGIVAACKHAWRTESPPDKLFELQDICAWATERIAASRGAAHAKRIYQNHLDRAREMLLALQGSSKWAEFKVRAAHIPDEIVRLDDFLGADSVDLTKAEKLSKSALSEIAVLRNAVIEDADMPVELQEFVLAQLGLLERSVSRFTTMGFSSFQEAIELSYGKLSLAMEHSLQPNTIKRMQQLLAFILKLHTGAEMVRDGVRLLQHIPVKALIDGRNVDAPE